MTETADSVFPNVRDNLDGEVNEEHAPFPLMSLSKAINPHKLQESLRGF